MKKTVIKIANSTHIIAGLYVCSLFVSTVLFSYFENKPLFDSLWWSCITSLTIGYGDMYPVTTAGRILGMLMGHFWIFFIIPMIIANILMNLIEDRNEFTHEEQLELFARMKRVEVKIDKVLDEV